MEFETKAQEEVYRKVEGYLKELFGEMVRPMPDKPKFITMPMGSAIAYVGIIPWTEDEAVINIRSYVVTDAEIDDELMHFLLQKNGEVIFGAFGLDSDDDIFFDHTILGSTCDKEEIAHSIMSVLSVADKYDDEIRSRWGGNRAIDHLLDR